MKEEFKPYIPADKITPEFTPTSIIIGVLLSIVFGAANAYLGLKVGLTISASIPAAVISMAVIRIIMRRDSILESNMVQTVGSAGESLAAGAIFTLPALFIWNSEGVMDRPSMILISVIALLGGLLGIFFMVPLRNALIVKEHGVLPYPEGTACAEVLLAGEEGGSKAKAVFTGIGVGALVKFLVDGVRAVQATFTFKVSALKTELSSEIYPALLGVGYICGPRISAMMFAGGMLGWFVLIPLIMTFGGDTVFYPASVSVSELYEAGGAPAIWSNYIKYIGAGMVAASGIISLVKTLPLITKTFVHSLRSLKNSGKSDMTKRTEKELDMRVVIAGVVLCVAAIWLIPFIPVTLIGAVIIVVFGFFFCTVSSRMVGLVGSSNNPISGMTIATVMIAAYLLKMTGDTGVHGMQGAIVIGSIICISVAMAGDTSQDLKTGYILGATPKYQQIGEIIGSIASALAIGGVMILLNGAYSFGSEELSCPQASLMKMIIEGVLGGNLPWTLILVGAFIAISVELLGIPSLPVAIGLYLPLELSTGVMIGGFVRLITDKINEKKQDESGDAVLLCSGLIAGEGITGIIIAILTVTGVMDKIDLETSVPAGNLIPIIVVLAVCFMIYKADVRRKNGAKG